jgi:hypothetical protein
METNVENDGPMMMNMQHLLLLDQVRVTNTKET